MKRWGTVIYLGLALMALSAAPAWANGGLVLSGNYLRAGIHSSGGLIDNAYTYGLQLDCAGAGNFGVVDYLKTPGAPFEFYSLGINGVYQEGGYLSGNNFGAVTKYGDAHLSAQTFFVYNTLYVNQTLYFALNGDTLYFNVWGINLGGSTLTNVVYARGLDPDPDANGFGSFDTINTISAGKVRAFGPWSGYYIELIDLTGAGALSVDANWDTNPYNLWVPHNDGDGDNTINMAWNLGNLAPGQYFDIDFAYKLGDPPPLYQTPLPPSGLLAASALAGLFALRRRRP